MMANNDNNPRRSPAATRPGKPPGRPSRLGTSGGFSGALGRHIEIDAPRGYYIDLRSKAISPQWPPQWYVPGMTRLHVVIIQWGIGCYERYVSGDGEAWLDAARRAGDHLLEIQERGGRHDGGWVHRFPHLHTYRVDPPWLSGMAQGEGASLLVRLQRTVGDERYAEAAARALRPMAISTADGGVAGDLEGGFLPEEYPTDPPSHVLNGGIFGLLGCYDVAIGLDDTDARTLAVEGRETLARGLARYDTGYWSRYDLFPHPVVNVATPMYHRLHIEQLRAMSLISPDLRFSEAANRFERYAASSLDAAHAFARKVLFRLAVPRSRRVANVLPWAQSARG